MNPDLDQSIRHAVATIVDAAPEPGDRPTSVVPLTEVAPARRYLPLLVAAAAAAITTAGIGLFVAYNHTGTIAPAGSSKTPGSTDPDRAVPDPLSVLLFPTGGGVVAGAASLTDTPNQSSAALLDPDGELHAVGMSPNYNGAERPNWGSRTVGDLQVWQGQEDQVLVYAVLDDCWAFSVTDSAGGVWDTDIIALLEGVTITNGTATVITPEGWESLGVGNQASTYQLELTTSAGEVSLLQAPDAALGALVAQRSNATGQPVDINGTPGWLLESSDSRYLAWTAEHTAVLLGGTPRLSVDELIEVAGQLANNQAAAWHDALNRQSDSPTPTTMEPTATLSEGTTVEDCAATSLSVNP